MVWFEAIIIAILLIVIATSRNHNDPLDHHARYLAPATKADQEAVNAIIRAQAPSMMREFQAKADHVADARVREIQHSLRIAHQAELSSLDETHQAEVDRLNTTLAEVDVELAEYRTRVAQLQASEAATQPIESVTQPIVTVEQASVTVADNYPPIPSPDGGYVEYLPPPKEKLGCIGDLVSDDPLVFGVGDDTVMDLNKVPHWIIAGSTGMGKSNLINLILLQAIQRDPTRLQLMLIDPKRVELYPYKDMPHVIGHATEVSSGVELLDAAITEMECRYKLLESARVRNLETYNDKCGDALPHIVVLVDEYADLMALARKQVEPMLMRLAALGRAAGIRLILATQRPSADVISTTLKNNISGRIAFGVPQHQDSQTILGETGAEALTKPGQALMVTGCVGGLCKVQMPYADDGLIDSITDPKE